MKVHITKHQKYLTNTIKMKKLVILSIFSTFLLIGCKSSQSISETKQAGDVTFKFVQVNDVYEIAPLSGGQYGGMARVAHVRDSISKVNPNTYLFMAGDFLNPSLLGTVKVDGERLQGKQMIEVMNAMNFDLVTFGNHEFDISEDALQKRLNESTFPWTSANVSHVTKAGVAPFKLQRDIGNIPVKDTHIITVVDESGARIKVGFFSVTLPSNPQDFVKYGDVFAEAERAYKSLENKVDVIIGLTHVTIEEDVELAKRLPKLQLIMGGHEHNNMLIPAGNGVVAKADANAKTVYIHTLTFNTQTKKLSVDSKLFPIDDKIASEPKVAAIVTRWNNVLERKIKEVISDPQEVLMVAKPPLDGTDSASRGIQTNLGDIITEAMANSFNEKVDGALVNGGSIRIDDMLDGEVTSIDIFRVLPFGGNVLRVEMTGSLLNEVLNYGKSKGGTGAYLQRYNIKESDIAGWMIGGKALKINQNYTIAISDFLMKGYDIPFLTPENKGVIKVHDPLPSEPASDIRKAIISFLKASKQ
ncbi:2',3'-cyclic-nucleotide 2'-phosphodiesterase/5'-or 3'-nucleotidase, 5'-nucleotidase family [Ulvibacter litoralis]|uniref:2',3'-cyclic-nucleotide 2'-phosphodiesterase/5'-or 3'-nucleotidase, 5'-nucleotidase family n=2 Tax=Ulvibacter litoralis TaxID=227084 RepID=A0A1G7GYH9_9FLAO|nr:2',3'-cyclic-nucleotide 2'-phosphodiesterase/5'-or 3'-nucleotidase, 5'-nucleotidase family [Ulvibacter litoralis]